MANLERAYIIDQLLRKTLDSAQARVAEKWTLYSEVVPLLEKLEEGRSGPSLTSERAAGQQNFDEFKAWAKEHGIVSENVNIQSYGDAGHGIVATANTKKGDVILQVPESCMLSTNSARTGPLKSFAESDQMASKMENVLLAVHLLCEVNHSESKWQPYLKTLPSSFSVPLYYSVNEMKLLKGSPVYEQALTLFLSIVRQYVYLLGCLKDDNIQEQFGFTADNFSFNDYKWAVATVMTRQNRVPITVTKDEPPVYCLSLIPFWDLLNHDSGTVTTMHDIGKLHTEYAAMRDFKKGDQIVMFYGERPNSDLLLHSGFFHDDNAHDYMVIKLGIGNSDTLAALKHKLLNALGVPISGEFVVGKDGTPDPQLFAFIRINAMTKDELEHFLSNPQECAKLGEDEGRVNDDNETKACLFLETRCKLLLRSYDTSLAEDRELLAKPVSYCEQCAIKLRSSEKKMLTALMNVLASHGLEEDL